MSQTFEIQMRPLEEIHPYEGNPRRNRAAIRAVAASIATYGFRQPIVVDEAGVVIAGHTRLLAAYELKLPTAPVHVASGLTPDQLRAYRLADNKSAELSEWDRDLLKNELTGLHESGFDLALTMFSEDEIRRLLPELGAQEGGDVPPPPKVAVSQLGAVYALGEHRLVVGDATDPAVLERLMDGAEADLLLTDPPYNVAYEGGGGWDPAKKSATRQGHEIQNDAQDPAAFRAFLVNAYHTAEGAMRKGAVFYIWHADSFRVEFELACRDVGWRVRQNLIWAKGRAPLGRQDYQWRHEPCLYGWLDGPTHTWMAERKENTVLEFPTPRSSDDHPTMKPVALFEYQLLNSSKPGDLVLDIFTGSGTTVIAAERTKRKARAVELDPRYADVIRRRWAELVHGEGCDWQSLTAEV